MQLPTHVGIIPDGNRRYAKKMGISINNAYNRGISKLFDVLKWSKDKGINTVTVWGFSIENFQRPYVEKRLLFRMFEDKIKDLLKNGKLDNVHINFIGVKNRFPSTLVRLMNKMEKTTKNIDDQRLNIAIGYSGRVDIIEACNNILNSKLFSSHVQKSNVDEEIFRKFLLSSSVSDVDLVIRTSGEMRVSGFFPWQTSYSELVFLKPLWPEITKKDFNHAIRVYSKRERRFGH